MSKTKYGMYMLISLIIFNQIYKVVDLNKVIRVFFYAKGLTLRILLFIIVVALSIYLLINTVLYIKGICGYGDMLSGICVGWMFSTANYFRNLKKKKSV